MPPWRVWSPSPIWIVALFSIASVLGVDLAPLLAGAGVAGVALGFGAQSLVRDCISGLFMLLEDQYGIGDQVDLGAASGTVERVSLRTTVLRGADGTVWHVPNGEVRRVGNQSKLWSMAVVDVDIARRRPISTPPSHVLRRPPSVCASHRSGSATCSSSRGCSASSRSAPTVSPCGSSSSRARASVGAATRPARGDQAGTRRTRHRPHDAADRRLSGVASDFAPGGAGGIPATATPQTRRMAIETTPRHRIVTVWPWASTGLPSSGLRSFNRLASLADTSSYPLVRDTRMTRAEQFDTIGFDADDTLWKSEDYFTVAEEMFVAKVGPYAPAGIDVLAALHATELDNVPVSGYGVKGYALSMVQAAITATGGRVPSSVIGELVDHAHEMLMHPVELLDGVPETLRRGRTHASAGPHHEGRPRAPDAQGAHVRASTTTSSTSASCSRRTSPPTATCSTSGASIRTGSSWSATR